MDLRKLKTLIDLVSDSNVTELEITEADGKVRIVKGGHTLWCPCFKPSSHGTCIASIAYCTCCAPYSR